MPFQLGNQEARKGIGNDHKRPKLLTQQIIAALHEEADKGERTTKLRKLVDALIDRAIGGDVTAIKEVFDRVEGKAPQAGSLIIEEKRTRTDWSREELVAFLNAHQPSS